MLTAKSKTKNSKWLDRVNNAIDANKTLIAIVIGLLIIILGLGHTILSLLSSRSTIVQLPPTIYPHEPEIKVGTYFANDKYYEVWGTYMVMEISNYNPMTVTEKFNNVLNIFDKDSRMKKEGDFKAIVDMSRSGVIERKFTRKKTSTEVQKDGETAIVTVEGVSSEKIGQRDVGKDFNCKYEIQMHMDGGHLYAEDLYTDCYDIKTVQPTVQIQQVGVPQNVKNK